MISGKNYHYILFDLDGTVTDSEEGILNSVRYSLSYFKLEIPDQNTLKKFIGPPLSKSLMEYYGFDAGKAAKAVQVYREYFSKKGIYENKLYPGIRDLLKTLHLKGKIIILATAKPTYFAEKIIRYFKIDPFFEEIVGSNMDGTRMEKKEIIQYILDLYPNEPTGHFVMIGDRLHDIMGANYHGIDSIWVQYGYGDEEEIINVSPTYKAERMEDLYGLLLKQA
jgi:phosphoglycolate phosphatase